MLVWAALAFSGFAWLARYAGTPGPGAATPPRWPLAAHLLDEDGRYTLVMVVHPECACSRASLHELSRIAARASGRLAITVLIDVPPGHTVGPDNELRTVASRIPETVVRVDPGGSESRRFGAQTSGHTFLYDPSGRLLFDGGITIARGHQGDNPGALAISALIAGERTPRQTAPTFGCLLARAGA